MKPTQEEIEAVKEKFTEHGYDATHYICEEVAKAAVSARLVQPKYVRELLKRAAEVIEQWEDIRLLANDVLGGDIDKSRVALLPELIRELSQALTACESPNVEALSPEEFTDIINRCTHFDKASGSRFVNHAEAYAALSETYVQESVGEE